MRQTKLSSSGTYPLERQLISQKKSTCNSKTGAKKENKDEERTAVRNGTGKGQGKYHIHTETPKIEEEAKNRGNKHKKVKF